jgi:hypothetical protein
MTRCLAIVLVAACPLLPATLHAAPRADGASIVHGSGRSRTDGAHDWAEANPGDVLASGVTVEVAAAEPMEMMLPDGVSIVLEPGAVGRWQPPGRLPTEEVNHFTRGYHFVLTEGELEVRLPAGPKGAHAFLVSTRAGALTGWRGKVHITSHGDTAVAAVYEGAAVVESNGRSFSANDSAGILMRKGLDPDRSRVVPSVPTWDPGTGLPSFAVVPAGTPAQTGFAWIAIPGATSYRVQIASDAAMTHVLQRATTAETSFGIAPDAQSGAQPPLGALWALWARVRAVGADGIVGDWSSPRPLRVLRYQPPAGAFVARDGAVVLPPRTALTLTNAEGLEVAYENVSALSHRVRGVPLYWARLTGPLHLPDDTPIRVVHMRDPAQAGEAELVLVHRELRADVQLSPTTARPGDLVDVRVTVWDPSGRIDPMGETLTIQAMFDLQPAPVAWQRAGNVWTARIRTHRTAAPSIVRVVVTDSLGLEVGRGFLELGSAVARAD